MTFAATSSDENRCCGSAACYDRALTAASVPYRREHWSQRTESLAIEGRNGGTIDGPPAWHHHEGILTSALDELHAEALLDVGRSISPIELIVGDPHANLANRVSGSREPPSNDRVSVESLLPSGGYGRPFAGL